MSEVSTEILQSLAEEFDKVCHDRHLMGGQKYGPVKYLEIDSLQMMIEEVADLANYARYSFIKLRLLQEALQDQGADANLGRQGFIGHGRRQG